MTDTMKFSQDIAVRFGGKIYVFEFELVDLEPEAEAIAKLGEKDCRVKYWDGRREVFLVGI